MSTTLITININTADGRDVAWGMVRPADAELAKKVVSLLLADGESINTKEVDVPSWESNHEIARYTVSTDQLNTYLKSWA
jgi:hypothetical protein|tara:strand:- start:388 stop:627 length:240 start_codon:yes stop_codon:yes gene_type:complete